jgi:VCBS repeat-containing protein
VDRNDIHTVSVVAQSGAVGTLTASVLQDTTGIGTGGVIDWNYQVDQSAVHDLTSSRTDKFGVTLADGHGGTATATISVSILL